MLRIFTTPNIMQNYVADPITYRFTSKLKEMYPQPICYEGRDELYVIRDKGVVNVLCRIMKSYNGFHFYKENGKLRWIHAMKPSRNYHGSRMVITLEDTGEYFKFTTKIILGKKKRDSYQVSVFGWLTVISLFLLFGLASGYENDSISTAQFIGYSVACLTVFGICSQIEQRINPCISSEDEK